MATMPVVPPAPALFSITNCWPSRRDIRSANMRANTSVLPPAANGTTTVTGFDGQTSCAQAAIQAVVQAVAQLDATAPTSSATAMRFILRFLQWLLFKTPPFILSYLRYAWRVRKVAFHGSIGILRRATQVGYSRLAPQDDGESSRDQPNNPDSA